MDFVKVINYTTCSESQILMKYSYKPIWVTLLHNYAEIIQLLGHQISYNYLIKQKLLLSVWLVQDNVTCYKRTHWWIRPLLSHQMMMINALTISLFIHLSVKYPLTCQIQPPPSHSPSLTIHTPKWQKDEQITSDLKKETPQPNPPTPFSLCLCRVCINHCGQSV